MRTVTVNVEFDDDIGWWISTCENCCLVDYHDDADEAMTAAETHSEHCPVEAQ